MPSSIPDIESAPELRLYLENTRQISPANLLRIQNLHGGVSNKTVQVFFQDGQSWVLKQALTKLRVAENWTSHPDRIFREAMAMRWFEAHLPSGRVPKLIFEDQTNHIIAMEAVMAPFANLKGQLLQGIIDPDWWAGAGQLLALMHQSGAESSQIPELFLDRHFFQTLRVEPYYLATGQAIPESGPFLQQLIQDTHNAAYTLTHGDFSPKNLLIKDGTLILLDHEVIHFGDGTFDLGFFTSHLLSKANHLRDRGKAFLAGIQDFWTNYQKEIGDWDALKEGRAIRHGIACLLARVVGLSPLEYLSPEARKRQVKIGKSLMEKPPRSLDALLTQYQNLLYDED
jgi:5-methylthioribose kinase